MSADKDEPKTSDGKVETELKVNSEDMNGPESDEAARFSPEEEAELVQEAQALKTEANALFTSLQYQDALDKYDTAIHTCPRYLHYDRAVLQSNISACHLKMEQWQDAIKSATDALDGLAKFEREDPRLNPEAADKKEGNPSNEKKDEIPSNEEKKKEEDDEVEEEIISTGASRSAPAPTPPPAPSSTETLKADVQRIRSKALMRRARARSEAGGWQNLAGAEEDYKTLSGMKNLAAADMRIVRAQLRDLPPRIKAAQEKEMGEMWGKLKDLGNGILKPFGLSTDNFQMVKDEKTGGYSMNFNQGGKSS